MSFGFKLTLATLAGVAYFLWLLFEALSVAIGVM